MQKRKINQNTKRKINRNTKRKYTKKRKTIKKLGGGTLPPFVNPLNNPITNEPLSIPEYVDLITGIIPWLPKTLGQVKIFEVILSPGIDSTPRSEGVKDSHKTMTMCCKVPKKY